MGPTPAKPRLKRGRRGCLESKGKPSWCLVPPPPTHQRMIVHSLAIAGTLWLGGFAISYKMQPPQCGREGASLPANRFENYKDSSAQVSALDGLVPLFGGTSGLGGMFLPGSQL